MHVENKMMKTDLRLSHTTYTRLNRITAEGWRVNIVVLEWSEERRLTNNDRIAEV